MAGPFGDALMRYSRTPTPSGGARHGSRAPNTDAIRNATPAPGAIKPSQSVSEAQLPPEIASYLGMMTGAPGAGSPPPPPLAAPAPVPEAPPPAPPIEASPAQPGVMPQPPTVPVAMRIRAPRPPDVDLQTLAITAPGDSWSAAFFDRNGRRADAPDYEQRHFVQSYIAQHGVMPTKAELMFQRFRNFDAEPGGISEFG